MKNFYSLNAGEFFVADELARQRPDLELYYPLKDKGVDLLALHKGGDKRRSIQVKESRVHGEKNHSWHQVRRGKIKDADVFIFITYTLAKTKHRLGFDKDFVVVPQNELERLCVNKKRSGGSFTFYFQEQENGQLLDIREGIIDFSPFHRAWHLI